MLLIMEAQRPWEAMDLEWTIKPVALALYTRRFMSLLESIRYTSDGFVWASSSQY
jgi:hypothetical protein